MFGYVRPLEGELKVWQLEAYKGVYCGLCHGLNRQCGFAARFVLSYDFVFLAMLLDEGQEPCAAVKRRCVAHPFAKRKCVECQGDAMKLAAEETVILTYYKLLDDFADEGLGKRLAARLAALALRPAYRRAAKKRGEFDRQVKQWLGELSQLERAASEKLDQVADAFARILRAAAPETADGKRGRVLAQLLYHLGRWIYLIDAADDAGEDRAQGRYNAAAARFGGEIDREGMKVTLDNSLAMMQSAFQLLEPNRWSGILENILYLGLPAVQKQVLDGNGKTNSTNHIE